MIKPNDDENRKLKRDIAVIEELQKQSVVTMQEYHTQKEESDVKMQALQLENATISREIKDLKNQLASLMSRLDGNHHP
ncbi:hypothetical protein [Cytobacillus kochii]|uniref:hypothetical protein n=1 Tax=Cytobacillus kochii TaxID=859143 RepID=UPI00203B4B22|nr:hypothetical protein [Cytobacillus kochii]MCM3322236.1 hypothetical protein [Cytobacillus kochii]MCM3345286.1 hypothetical protein [Cytobacillus kochii]